MEQLPDKLKDYAEGFYNLIWPSEESQIFRLEEVESVTIADEIVGHPQRKVARTIGRTKEGVKLEVVVDKEKGHIEYAKARIKAEEGTLLCKYEGEQPGVYFIKSNGEICSVDRKGILGEIDELEAKMVKVRALYSGDLD